MIYPPTIIDYGTDADAGFWADALRFAPFPHTDYPVRRAAPDEPSPPEI